MNSESLKRESQKCIELLQRDDLKDVEKQAIEAYAHSIRFELWRWIKFAALSGQ